MIHGYLVEELKLPEYTFGMGQRFIKVMYEKKLHYFKETKYFEKREHSFYSIKLLLKWIFIVGLIF